MSRYIDADRLKRRIEVEISDLLEILETTQDKTERYVLQTMVTGRVNFIKEIEKADTVDAEPKWIPTSEKLPNKFERVLITVRYDNDKKDRVVQVGWGLIDKFGNWAWHYTEEYMCESKVLAWTPLPEPYEVTE